MSDVVCRYCGKSNLAGYSYCSSCGKPSVSQLQADETKEQLAASKKSVDRTRTGTILVIIAVLLNWIPYADYLGLLLGAIGAILIILGSGVFGGHHHASSILAVVIFVLGELIAEAAALGIAASTGTNPSTSVINNEFYILLGSTVIVDLSYVLLLLYLENSIGRILVISGFVSIILITAYIASVLQPLILTLVKNPSEAQYISNQLGGISYLHILSVIPAVLTALGYWTVIRRINKGEIPAGAPGPTAS